MHCFIPHRAGTVFDVKGYFGGGARQADTGRAWVSNIQCRLGGFYVNGDVAGGVRAFAQRHLPRSKQFSCRRQAKALLRSAKAEFQRQGHGAAPGLARVGCAQPGRHQHPAIHVGPGLRGVGQRAQIGP